MKRILRKNLILERNNSTLIVDKLGLTLDQAIELKSYHKKYDLALANMLQKDFMNDDAGGLTFSEWYANNISKYKPKLQGLVDWLTGRNERPDPAEPSGLNPKDISFEQALQYSDSWHDHIAKVSYAVSRNADVQKEQENAIIVFPDGSYWIDLETSKDSDEAEAMGHCGNTSADTLISYRDNEGEPHLTMAFNYSDRSYQQLKGKGNSKPSPKYHDAIYRIFKELNINSYRSEYDPEDDFIITDLPKAQSEELMNAHPDLLPPLMQMVKILDGDLDAYLSDFSGDFFSISGLTEIHLNTVTVQMNHGDFEFGDDSSLVHGVITYFNYINNSAYFDRRQGFNYFRAFLDTPEGKKLHNKLYSYFLENYNGDEEFGEFENMQDVVINGGYDGEEASVEMARLVELFYIKNNDYFVHKIITERLVKYSEAISSVLEIEIEGGGTSILCDLHPYFLYNQIVASLQNGDDKVIIEGYYDLSLGNDYDELLYLDNDDNPELFAQFLKDELKL